MHHHRSLRHSWVFVSVAILLLLVSGGLSLAQANPNQSPSAIQPMPTEDEGLQINQPLQPLPTEEDEGPIFIGTLPPILPTAVPTRPPRVTPTPIPTEAPPRVTPTATSDLPDPNPTVVVQPTVPTVIDPQPEPPGPGDSILLPDNPIVSPYQVGWLTATTRLCPPGVDPTTLAWDVAALQQQCTGVLHQSGHVLKKQLVSTNYSFREEFGGEGVTFTTQPGMQWLSGSLQTPPAGVTGFKNLAVTCTTPPNTAAEHPLSVYETLVALVEIKAQQTTSCTRYVHLAVETGSVTAHAWQCPAGYDWTVAGADPATDCAQPLDGLFIRPWPEGHFKGYVYTGYSGDDGPGTVTFTTLIPGPYFLSAFFEPHGSVTDVQFLGACGSDPVAEVFGQPILAEDPPIPWHAHVPNLDITSGGTIECHVYSVPPAGSGQVAPVTAGVVPDRWVAA